MVVEVQRRFESGAQSEVSGGGCPAADQSINLARLEGLERRQGRERNGPQSGPEDVPAAKSQSLNEGQLLRSARSRSLRLRAGDSRAVPEARARTASRPLHRS